MESVGSLGANTRPASPYESSNDNVELISFERSVLASVKYEKSNMAIILNPA